MKPASAGKAGFKGICTLCSLSFRTSLIWTEKGVASFYNPT